MEMHWRKVVMKIDVPIPVEGGSNTRVEIEGGVT
jgi:hypothetical protein